MKLVHIDASFPAESMYLKRGCWLKTYEKIETEGGDYLCYHTMEKRWMGGHKYFPDFYAHEEELDWLSGKFPLSMETVRDMVADRCELPEGYDVGSYELFQGRPSGFLHDGDRIDLGGRVISVFLIFPHWKRWRCSL